MASITNFPADVVPQAPEDPLFGLMAAYKADESPDKVDLVSNTQHSRRGVTTLRDTDSFIGNWRIP